MESIKGKRLLLLGGPSLMCDVVQKARELGVYTIVTDWYEPDVAVAKKEADEYWMVSSADVDTLVNLVKEKHIDGVYTQFTDSALPYCQQICEKAGLPFFIDGVQEYNISNKEQSKQLCMKYGIPVSKRYRVTEQFLKEDIDLIEWPVLTKPTDNSGQRGITICKDLESLKKGYLYAKENSKEGRVVVEEYMEGDYVVLNFTLQDGNLYLSCMADKPVIDEQYSNGMIRLPKAYIMPSKYLDLFYKKRFNDFQALAKGMGLKNGNWSVECVVRNDDFYVFEMQFRLGGMRHYTFVQAENGIDTLEMHIRYALTGRFEGYNLSDLNTPYYKKIYCSLNMLLKDGVITRTKGIEILNRIPEVKSYLSMHQIGDKVEISGTVFQIFMKVSIEAENRDALIKVLNYIQDNIVVEDEYGENMLLKILED